MLVRVDGMISRVDGICIRKMIGSIPMLHPSQLLAFLAIVTIREGDSLPLGT